MRREDLFNKKSHLANLVSPSHYLSQSTQNLKGSSKQSQQLTKKLIGDYEFFLNDVIGSGFSSTVYLGKHKDSDVKLAVKVIDMTKINELEKMLLETELKVLKKLDSDNVIKMIEYMQTKNNTYIVSEYCNKGDLQQQKKKISFFEENVAKEYIYQICMGFMELVRKKVYHRDLKPANIMLNNETLKIADLGFCFDASDSLTCIVDYNVGTPNYMCPYVEFDNFHNYLLQTIKNNNKLLKKIKFTYSLTQNRYSFQSDIWSIGVIYYELLYGTTPWRSECENKLAQMMLKIPVNFSATRIVSDESKNFIKQCLNLKEKERFTPVQMVSHPLFDFRRQEINEMLIKYGLQTQISSISQNSGKENLNYISLKLSSFNLFLHISGTYSSKNKQQLSPVSNRESPMKRSPKKCTANNLDERSKSKPSLTSLSDNKLIQSQRFLSIAPKDTNSELSQKYDFNSGKRKSDFQLQSERINKLQDKVQDNNLNEINQEINRLKQSEKNESQMTEKLIKFEETIKEKNLIISQLEQQNSETIQKLEKQNRSLQNHLDIITQLEQVIQEKQKKEIQLEDSLKQNEIQFIQLEQKLKDKSKDCENVEKMLELSQQEKQDLQLIFEKQTQDFSSYRIKEETNNKQIIDLKSQLENLSKQQRKSSKDNGEIQNNYADENRKLRLYVDELKYEIVQITEFQQQKDVENENLQASLEGLEEEILSVQNLLKTREKDAQKMLENYQFQYENQLKNNEIFYLDLIANKDADIQKKSEEITQLKKKFQDYQQSFSQKQIIFLGQKLSMMLNYRKQINNKSLKIQSKLIKTSFRIQILKNKINLMKFRINYLKNKIN